MNAFAYLIRRETWEHKGLIRGPVITAAVLIVVTLLVLFKVAAGGEFGAAGQFSEWMVERNLSSEMLAPHYLRVGSPIIMSLLFIIIFLAGTVVAIFYMLDSLYAERKNRSILFWKSLPISDTETVLSKLVTATVLVPVVALFSVVVCWIVLQLIAAVTIGLLGGNGWLVLWQPDTLFHGIAIAIESGAGLLLWYLPIASWLLLVSVWARRSVFLWAVLPPLSIVFVERWLFDSEYFRNLLTSRVEGFLVMFRDTASSVDIVSRSLHGSLDVSVPASISQMVSFTQLLSEPGLYGGSIVAAGFITGAIFLRRYHDET